LAAGHVNDAEAGAAQAHLPVLINPELIGTRWVIMPNIERISLWPTGSFGVRRRMPAIPHMI